MSKLVPPVAKRVPFTHKHHNRLFEDPYHYFKDMNPKEKRPEIIEYLKDENQYSQKHFEQHSELSNKLYEEMVSRIKEDDEGVPYFRAPYYYYHRMEKGKQYPIYCRKKDTLDHPEEIILNQNEMDQEYQDLADLQVSPDHSLLAYSMDFNGNELYQIFFKELTTGTVLADDTIENSSGEIIWAADGKTVFYLTLDDIHRPDKLHRHTLGTKQDVLVYHETDLKFNVGCFKSQSGEYIFIGSESSETTEYHYLEAKTPMEEPKLFQAREVGHLYDVEHQGNRFLIRSNGKKKYLNFRLCSCPIDNTNMQNWEEVMPYNPFVHLKEVLPFKNHIVCVDRANALATARVLQAQNGTMDSSSDSYYVEIPENLYDLSLASYKTMSYDSTLLRFKYNTPVSQTKELEFNLVTKETRLLKEVTTPHFNSGDYTTEMIYAPIPNALRISAPFDTPVPDSIPISILYKTSLFKKDGTNPCYLYGYGSYGISIPTSWNSSRISMADRGFVTATAHIRGGGDCGIAWYEVGKYLNKKNTFHDFITAAKKLVEEKYTSHHLMGIDGRSAGGLLIGSVLNMEPSICKVALAGVPFVDVINTMMDPSIPLTINEYEEWGNPNEVDYFDYMLSYSPYDNIPEGVQFPNLLVKAGLFDPRVQYWEPTKWVAKLRHLDVTKQQGRNPSILIYDCKMGSGHFGSTGRYAWIKEIATEIAFLVNCIFEKTPTL
jgi:oligopeptidase B